MTQTRLYVAAGIVGVLQLLTADLCYAGSRAGKVKDQGVDMPAAIETLEVKSNTFKWGEMIPGKYGCDGDDISPQLSWSKVPEGTRELALICDDPDAPMGTWVHWVAYGISPDTINLPDNVPKKEMAMGFRQGKNSFGRIGYGGPCPPRSSTHRYFFRVYALNKTIDLKPGVTKEAVMKAIEGHVLARGELMGRYGR